METFFALFQGSVKDKSRFHQDPISKPSRPSIVETSSGQADEPQTILESQKGRCTRPGRGAPPILETRQASTYSVLNVASFSMSYVSNPQ